MTNYLTRDTFRKGASEGIMARRYIGMCLYVDSIMWELLPPHTSVARKQKDSWNLSTTLRLALQSPNSYSYAPPLRGSTASHNSWRHLFEVRSL